MLAVAGATAIDLSVFVPVCTLSVAVPVIPLRDAVTLVEPEATPVTSPLLLIEAMAELPTDQVTLELTFAVDPSLYFAVAVNCCVVPVEMLTLAGVTETETRVFEGGGVEEPVTPWHPSPASRSASEEVKQTQKSNVERSVTDQLLAEKFGYLRRSLVSRYRRKVAGERRGNGREMANEKQQFERTTTSDWITHTFLLGESGLSGTFVKII